MAIDWKLNLERKNNHMVHAGKYIHAVYAQKKTLKDSATAGACVCFFPVCRGEPPILTGSWVGGVH